MKRSSWLWGWIVVALVIGAVGGLIGSATAMRVANGVFAGGFGYLLWRALVRGRTGMAVLFGVLAGLFVVAAIQLAFTAPIYEVLGSIIDEM